MLAVASETLPEDVQLIVRGIEEPLPDGPFDLVFSALAVHHLDGRGKAELFERVANVLRPGGRFVMGDVIVPADPADAITPLSPDYDLPSAIDELMEWLNATSFEPTLTWESGDLAIITADLPTG